MSAAAPAINPVALRGAEELPAPVSGQRHEIGSSVGRLTYYSAGPEIPGKFPPLLLIHSINAAGSAYEIKPLYEHYRQSRTVYALELPGFGHSQRGAREYTVRMMTDAILIAIAEIQNDHGRGPIDALAVSLSSEFLARAVTEMPLAFRSAALVSPTGFRSRDRNTKWRNGTREMPWTACIFRVSAVERGLLPAAHQPRGNSLFPEQDMGLARYRRRSAGIRLSDHAPARRAACAVLFRVRISVQRGHHPHLSFADLAGLDEPRRTRRFCRLQQQDAGRRPRQLDHPGISKPARCRTSKPKPSSSRPMMPFLPACRRRHPHKEPSCHGLVWNRDGADWPNRDSSSFVEAAGLRWHVQRMGEGPPLAFDSRHRRRNAFVARTAAAAGAAFLGDRAGLARTRFHPIAVAASVVAAGHGGGSRRAASQTRSEARNCGWSFSRGGDPGADVPGGPHDAAAIGGLERRFHAVRRRCQPFVLAAGEIDGAQSIGAARVRLAGFTCRGGGAVDRQYRFDDRSSGHRALSQAGAQSRPCCRRAADDGELEARTAAARFAEADDSAGDGGCGKRSIDIARGRASRFAKFCPTP